MLILAFLGLTIALPAAVIVIAALVKGKSPMFTPDQITALAQQIASNTAAYDQRQAAAVAAAVAPLNQHISDLQAQLATAQSDAAPVDAALEALSANVTAQTSDVSPPQQDTGSGTEGQDTISGATA